MDTSQDLDYLFVSRSHLTGLVDFMAKHQVLEFSWSTPPGSSASVLTITTTQGVYTWASTPPLSSSSRGPTIYAIDALLPAATAIVGAQDTKTQEFLDQLGVPHQSPSSWSRHASKHLTPVVAQMAEANMEAVCAAMNHAGEDVQLSMDEQYSRPQRNGSLGHAPYCSVNVTWERTGQVCCTKHVDRDKLVAGHRTRAGLTRPRYRLTAAQAASLGRKDVFVRLSQQLLVNVSHMATDAASCAGKSVNEHLRPRWPEVAHQHDLWHKTRGWGASLQLLANQKPQKHSRAWSFPQLHELLGDFTTLHQLAGKLKRHFVWVSNNCEGSPDKFLALWQQAGPHYAQKLALPPADAKGLADWLEHLFSKDHSYFLHGLQTSYTESYHSTCNKYCPKGYPWSYCTYQMRKNLATLHWNHAIVGLDHHWRAELLTKYMKMFYCFGSGLGVLSLSFLCMSDWAMLTLCIIVVHWPSVKSWPSMQYCTTSNRSLCNLQRRRAFFNEKRRAYGCGTSWVWTAWALASVMCRYWAFCLMSTQCSGTDKMIITKTKKITCHGRVPLSTSRTIASARSSGCRNLA